MADLKNNGQNAPEKSAPAKKPAKNKVSFGEKMKNFFRGFRSEFKKIVWYPWNLVRKNSVVVIIAIAIIGVIVALLDLAFSQGLYGLGKLISF